MMFDPYALHSGNSERSKRFRRNRILNTAAADGVASRKMVVKRNFSVIVEPKDRGLWLVLGWLLLFLVVYLSLTPAPIQVDIEQGDKASHALAYFVLMSWFSNLYPTRSQRGRLALALVAMGVTLEIVQGFVGYRSFEVADMAANAAGVLLGWFVAPPRTPNYLGVAETLWRPHK